MGFPLSPDHFLKVLISRDDDTLFADSPMENLLIVHSRIPLGNPNDIVPLVRQPTSQNATRIDICEELHLGSHAVKNRLASDQVVCVEQGCTEVIRLQFGIIFQDFLLGRAFRQQF